MPFWQFERRLGIRWPANRGKCRGGNNALLNINPVFAIAIFVRTAFAKISRFRFRPPSPRRYFG
jgi:hypothetical protein